MVEFMKKQTEINLIRIVLIGFAAIAVTTWCADRADKIALGFAQGYAEADAFWGRKPK